ncbi:MAG: hypothetical protein GY906_23830 [bacterium]|nr:hypothetical protein [bacterium]
MRTSEASAAAGRIARRASQGTEKGKEQHKKRSEKYRKKTQDAENGGNRWTDRQIALAFNSDYTDSDIAFALRRSTAAVVSARIRYATKAPKDWASKASKRIEA